MDNMTLEDKALSNFDDLNRRGELLWTETKPILFKDGPSDFEFRVAPSFEKKPILPADAKGRSEATNPFGHDDPAFTISKVGGSHTLRLNKFCVVRPQFVLHTNQFEPQSDPLSASDVFALWQALGELGREKYAGIYNCGAEAGSSIGHKHMQILPKSSMPLFPEEVLSERAAGPTKEPLKHPRVPFEHAILPVVQGSTGDTVFSAYQRLCKHLRLVSGGPHNAFLTENWIIVIPRTKAKIGIMAANAASVLGMVWVKSYAELQAWKDYGPMNVLREVGLQRGLP